MKIKAFPLSNLKSFKNKQTSKMTDCEIAKILTSRLIKHNNKDTLKKIAVTNCR